MDHADAKAEIISRQALHTLTQLHDELAGKIEISRESSAQMVRVVAVMKTLDPEVNLRMIAPKRRVIGNTWFKRRTMFRGAADVMRRLAYP
jgi:hypothetical protein